MSVSSTKGEDLRVKTVEEIGMDLHVDAGTRKEMEKKLVRKIDLRMMPLMMLICPCLVGPYE